MRHLLILLTTYFLALSVPLASAIYDTSRSEQYNTGRFFATTSNELEIDAALAESIQDQYIVVLKSDVSKEEHLNTFWSQLVLPLYEGEGVKKWFEMEERGLKGYVVKGKQDLVNEIRGSAHVEYVEKDQIVHAYYFDKLYKSFFGEEDQEQTVSEVAEVAEEDEGDDDQDLKKYRVENDAPWGLSRISHRDLPKSEKELHRYPFYKSDGKGVTVYIVDTGINVKHDEFQGRARWGKTIPDGDEDEDGNGHGSHVAGTIAGKTFGVAKKAHVVAVKVLRSNGGGSMSDVISGVEWVINDHKNRTAQAAKSGKKAKSVANMSLGGGRSRVLDEAVNAAVLAGIHFAVAAGNSNMDACFFSPAAASEAISVGASTIEDTRAFFSNWGSCVHIFAPGHQILSSWKGAKDATNTISGTSMASPHIAGLVASLISRKDWEDLSPKKLREKLIATGSKGLLKGMPRFTRTPNVLAYSQPPKAKK